MKIDLNDFRGGKNIKVLSGRERGKELRNQLKLNEEERRNDIIEINIPEEIFSLNSSYFLGLFGPSVRSLGEINFRNKYHFICDDIIMSNVEDGISLALKESDPLKGE